MSEVGRTQKQLKNPPFRALPLPCLALHSFHVLCWHQGRKNADVCQMPYKSLLAFSSLVTPLGIYLFSHSAEVETEAQKDNSA